MGLKNLKIKRCYDSDTDDVLNDFYIPALSESVLYRRLAGFFSSTSLAIAAKGISQLILNGGRIELVTSPRFNQNDIEAIKNNVESIESTIERVMLDDLEVLENKFVKDHVRAFGWMLANKLMTIKVAVVTSEDGLPMDEISIKNLGLFHLKVGILEDAVGNKLSFSGSENETSFGWIKNVEEFKVFKNWIPLENQYFKKDEHKFNKYWANEGRRIKTFALPDAVRRKLIDKAPDNLNEIDLSQWDEPHANGQIRLRSYQKDAVECWLNNDFCGIFDMATGTGKTITALQCLDEVLKKPNKHIIVLTCPYNHLVDQWKKELKKKDINIESIIADSRNRNWKNDLVNRICDLGIGVYDELLIYTTHDTFSSKDFINIINKAGDYCDDLKIMLLADEVHGIGSPKRKEGLLARYDYRLGLSATPQRWFDSIGTDAIFSYFKDVVYTYSLEDAIHNGYLTPYIYKPYFVKLTEEEYKAYEQQSKKIGRMYHVTKNDSEKKELFSLLCILRQQIVRNAVNKIDMFIKLLENVENIEHCLIYCSPKQIKTVQRILNKKNIIQHKFTQIEGIKKESKYGGLSERDHLLNQFSKGVYQVLVSMRCLDEGVDIPPARLAFMLDNSGNPKEYIQRRGRILRKHENKEYATIYDIIVEPSHSDSNFLNSMETRIFTNELRRYEAFSKIAQNSNECLATINRIKSKHKMEEIQVVSD